MAQVVDAHGKLNTFWLTADAHDPAGASLHITVRSLLFFICIKKGEIARFCKGSAFEPVGECEAALRHSIESRGGYKLPPSHDRGMGIDVLIDMCTDMCHVRWTSSWALD